MRHESGRRGEEFAEAAGHRRQREGTVTAPFRPAQMRENDDSRARRHESFDRGQGALDPGSIRHLDRPFGPPGFADSGLAQRDVEIGPQRDNGSLDQPAFEIVEVAGNTLRPCA